MGCEINSSGEQRIRDIWRTLKASTFLSVTTLKQLVLEGQLVTFSVGSEIKRSRLNGGFMFQHSELKTGGLKVAGNNMSR